MKTIHFKFIAIAVIGLVAAGCAAMERHHHRHIMRGSIVNQTKTHAVICIGTAHGARIGDQLAVYRVERRGGKSSMADGFGSLGGEPVRYVRVRAGSVRIEKIRSHFASARVLTGKAQVGYLVELDRRTEAKR